MTIPTERIEKRVFIRLSGGEVEYLKAVLENRIPARILKDVANDILDKLESGLGRANRLHKVLEENPAITLDDWEQRGGWHGNRTVRRPPPKKP